VAFNNYQYSVGLRNVGSYQISGQPFLTGALLATDEEIRVLFPNVTREFTVINSGSTGTGPILRIHFNSTSSSDVYTNHNYITLENDDQAITLHTKCKEVWVSCVGNGGNDNGFEIIANLTEIKASHMYTLTGSGVGGVS
jgi:hypothetical protein